ncbi:hypothetical protein BO71DRAFT_488552 [Aspergillus ellipticus CBS 707.79]|uniref:C6 finger domain protein n=1 Tax=Aspergillus ellipticus CBS 707.79 TaxID=1448320 RepID=A0A319CU07_9EURO|nr:hypothetical protein BO71DRAFT_488552 [Aspergillus ellipticus CBS 707.79]
MDSFDSSSAYFSIRVPILAATRPMLKASVCSLAAKHLHRLASQPTASQPHRSPLGWIAEDIDGKFQSVNFYDQTLTYLKEALGSEAADVETATALSRREEMFAVIAILCITEWRAHLSALPFLHLGVPGGSSPGYPFPNSSMQVSRSVFWSLARQDCLSAYPHQTGPGDLDLWRNFDLAIDPFGLLLPTTPGKFYRIADPWLEEARRSNALIWIMGKICNLITSGDGLTAGEFESPPGHRPWFGATQEDHLERWKSLERELRNWHNSLPETFNPCAQKPLALSELLPVSSGCPQALLATLFTIPMCAVTIQTYLMARILLLINQPQESTAIRSTVTARLRSYRETSIEVLQHARQVCSISLAGLPDAMLPHSVQPLFVAGQCFEEPWERQLVLKLLRGIERDIRTW